MSFFCKCPKKQVTLKKVTKTYPLFKRTLIIKFNDGTTELVESSDEFISYDIEYSIHPKYLNIEKLKEANLNEFVVIKPVTDIKYPFMFISGAPGFFKNSPTFSFSIDGEVSGITTYSYSSNDIKSMTYERKKIKDVQFLRWERVDS